MGIFTCTMGEVGLMNQTPPSKRGRVSLHCGKGTNRVAFCSHMTTIANCNLLTCVLLPAIKKIVCVYKSTRQFSMHVQMIPLVCSEYHTWYGGLQTVPYFVCD